LVESISYYYQSILRWGLRWGLRPPTALASLRSAFIGDGDEDEDEDEGEVDRGGRSVRWRAMDYLDDEKLDEMKEISLDTAYFIEAKLSLWRRFEREHDTPLHERGMCLTERNNVLEYVQDNKDDENFCQNSTRDLRSQINSFFRLFLQEKLGKREIGDALPDEYANIKLFILTGPSFANIIQFRDSQSSPELIGFINQCLLKSDAPEKYKIGAGETREKTAEIVQAWFNGWNE
jgi:hypothetical protein